MRTNKEILSDFKGRWNCLEYDDVLKAMKKAQKEIVEHILQRAANRAEITELYGPNKEEYAGKEFEIYTGRDNDVLVKYHTDKQSILSLKDELIKEIENS